MVADNFLGFLRGIFLSLVSSALITITISSHAEVISTEENGDQLTVLMAMLFDDPTNLELNFQIMQAQMAEGNLEAAEATLERVLILDPTSRLARFLMAEIRIQLGKLASAKTLLQELVEDPDTNADTKERAYILIEQINAASKTTRHSGGYVIYAGQTQNAFGRSEENQILFLDLPVENTTKDKSDQYYGYDLYYRFLNELDYQTPTQIDSGIKFSKRDTHDPSLSDLKTFSADISLIRIDGYRATLGLFGSYTDVNNQDFSRSIGTTISGRTTLFNAVEVSANLTANRSIYMPVETIADNPDKSSRSYSLQADVTRPTGFGFLKLGLSGGLSKATNSINDYAFEKAQLSFQARMGRFTLGGSVSRQATRYDEADTFVSSERQKTHTNEASLNIQVEAIKNKYTGTIAPYLNMKTFESTSNIPNYERNGGEVTFGIGSTF